MNTELIPLVRNPKHSKFCAELVVLSVWWSEYFPSLQLVLCTLKNIGLNRLGLCLVKICAWGSCHSGNPVPRAPGTSAQRWGPLGLGSHGWPACLLNLACLVLVQRENAAPWSSWRVCASLHPQLLFGFAPLYIQARNTGNKILSKASAQLNVFLHCLWIKTNRNYLSPDELFLYLLAWFLILIWSKN